VQRLYPSIPGRPRNHTGSRCVSAGRPTTIPAQQTTRGDPGLAVGFAIGGLADAGSAHNPFLQRVAVESTCCSRIACTLGGEERSACHHDGIRAPTEKWRPRMQTTANSAFASAIPTVCAGVRILLSRRGSGKLTRVLSDCKSLQCKDLRTTQWRRRELHPRLRFRKSLCSMILASTLLPPVCILPAPIWLYASWWRPGTA
jgi:hypothetical protein